VTKQGFRNRFSYIYVCRSVALQICAHRHCKMCELAACLSTVQELFGDVGPLKNARLVKPGTAEVIFVNMEDAVAAVKTYHMRLLDGKMIILCCCSVV